MTKDTEGRFLLLYGSQTGQAKAIAEEIYENAPNHGFQPEIHCLSVTDKKFSIDQETCMVMVVSTTGDGEPPDTACKFWRRLKKKTLPSDHLANLNYALLGLGDSNYNNFCRNPKNFDKRFEELGAKKFYQSTFADDAVGLEVAVEPWIDGLWSALRKHLGTDGTPIVSNGGKETADGITDLRPCSENGTDADSSTDKTDRSKTEQISQTKEPDVVLQAIKKEGSRTTVDDVGKTSVDGRTNETQDNTDAGTSKVEVSGSGTGDDSRTKTAEDGSKKSTDEIRTTPSLTHSVPPLSESALTLPLLPPEFLQVEFTQNSEMKVNSLSPQGSASYPSAKSPVTMATIVSTTCLTRDDAVKTALDVELDISDSNIDYQPGDAFSIICPNPSAEVNLLMERLGLTHQAEEVFTIKLIAGTKKRRAAVPDFIPQPCSVSHALTHCCDIRTPPKKAFMRMLVEFATNEQEKRRLQELCSKQGAGDYAKYIRDANLSILDILMAFPTCCPPLDRLLEHLPRLQARPYSISSSPLVNATRLHFVFNIIEFPKTSGRTLARQGVCTGWLNTKTLGLQDKPIKMDDDVGKNMSELSLQEQLQIPIFTRTNTHFRLPDDPSTPIIMIGPGTGVAPFVGFLEHRQMLQCQAAENEDVKFGSAWLFFGCRHQERDYLHRDKLQSFMDKQILTKLVVSFSRDSSDSSSPRYVQDNLRLCSEDVLDLLLEKGAVLYVCGDAKNMARNVNETLLELISKRTGKGAYEATLMLAKLREEKRYREDIWT